MPSNGYLHIGYNAVYLAVLAVVLVAGREWLLEHDARLRAEQFSADAKQMIADWKSSQQQRTVQAAQQTAVIRKQQQATKTPQQAAENLVKLLDLPKAIEVTPVTIPAGNMLLPVEDVAPLYNAAAEGKVCAVQLAACTANLEDEKRISGKLEDENKKWQTAAGHHGFFGKLWGGTKKVGIVVVAIAAGYLAGHH